MSVHRSTTIAILLALCACGRTTPPQTDVPPADPRVGLKAGLMDAGEAVSNLKVVAKAVSPSGFLGITNSDIAFTGNYAIQGNYNGPVIWDISKPASPVLVTAYVCPASQNDVSVYRNLMFMSAEARDGRVDCKPGGVKDTVSQDRMRGVRIFDISDIRNPRLVKNVQTCRGSHTHTVLEDPKDRENIYIYVSGSSSVRSPNELPGCVRQTPDQDPNSSLWRIEVIKVPVANPERAEIVNRTNIFAGLRAPVVHGAALEDSLKTLRDLETARRTGVGFVARSPATGKDILLGDNFVEAQLDTIVSARGGTGNPTAADSAALRANLQAIVDRNMTPTETLIPGVTPISSTRQCHDITVYPSLGLAGGACGGHGLLLDIKDPVNPVRIDAVSDSNFAFWHSATFNNDGTSILFTDEWGGGRAARCRASDKKEWGGNAIFSVENRKMTFKSYYKMPAAQTSNENCVAHNGSLIPIPGRDVMIQGWYQGGISVFDWTDPANPIEIASFDRGPVDSTRLTSAGSWSAYWYNGAIYSSEIARGLDIAELVPSEFVTQNEIDAAKTVRWTYLNAQGQPKIEWPPSFPLAKAYVDQLERSKCMTADGISAVRQTISRAERSTGPQRATTLSQLAAQLGTDASSCNQRKVVLLQKALNEIGNVIVP
jgi:LVIVD repeat-containing protein